MCLCVDICIHMCACRSQGSSGVFLFSVCYFFEAESLTGPEAQASLTGQRALPPAISTPALTPSSAQSAQSSLSCSLLKESVRALGACLMLLTSRDLEVLHFESLFDRHSSYDIENAEKNKKGKVALCLFENIEHVITPFCFFK